MDDDGGDIDGGRCETDLYFNSMSSWFISGMADSKSDESVHINMLNEEGLT